MPIGQTGLMGARGIFCVGPGWPDSEAGSGAAILGGGGREEYISPKAQLTP